MIVKPEARGHVALHMGQAEFLELVEWLEGLAPYDGQTKDLRREYDRLFPDDAELMA